MVNSQNNGRFIEICHFPICQSPRILLRISKLNVTNNKQILWNSIGSDKIQSYESFLRLIETEMYIRIEETKINNKTTD